MPGGGKPFQKGNKLGTGRRPGSSNKITVALKDMIEGALEELGGQAWLVKQAREYPAAFMQLVGKLIPKDIHLNAEVRHTLADIIAGSYERNVIDAEPARQLPPSSGTH
jgi:hypothetical protein